MESEDLLSNCSYCRLCCEKNKNGISLFTEGENSENLGTLVNRYLPIKVDFDDPFPKSICPGCHIQLEAAKSFMDLIIQGQAKLRTLLKTQLKCLEKEERLMQKFEEALKTHNPSASLETYTVQTDENGEKYIIQIFSEGPLFLPEHELTLKAQGQDRPKRKRGRPPKVTINQSEASSKQVPNEQDIEAEGKDDNTNISESEDKVMEQSSSTTGSEGGRSKRKIKPPARYDGAVQGKELDKILQKEGVIDEEVIDIKEEIKQEVDMEAKNEEAKTPIGIVTTDDGLENPVYIRRPRIKKYGHKKKQKYTCDVCNKEFLHVGRFAIHKRRHHQLKYACQGNDCHIESEDRNIILQHQTETEHDGKLIISDPDPLFCKTELPEEAPEVSEEKPVKCPTCDKSFACKQNYEVHLKAVHDGQKPYKCDKCSRTFAYGCSLKVHTISHKNKDSASTDQFRCDKCDKVFNHPSSLIYHKDTEHGNHRFICNKCNKSFRHRQLLQRHQTVHTDERPFQCAECSMAFKTKTNLINHENTHTGEKIFTCAICGQNFVHKTSLAMHMRWHEGNKPYECDVCKKSFSQKGNLNEHRRIHTGEKPFKCDLCGRKFTTSSQWKLHSKRHTGEKPHSCAYCQKRFLHKDTYETHIRRHLDIRPFKCSYCPKKFTEAWACSRHQRIHLGDKRYRCDICDKDFTDVSNYNKHKRIHLKNGIKPDNLNEAQVSKGASQPAPIGVFIIPSEPQATDSAPETTAKVEVNTSNNLEIQELLDAEGNPISLTTADGQPIPIVSSNGEKIQGLMPDGTLVSFDILSEEQNKRQQNEQAQVAPSQEINLVNTEIQFMEENSISNPSVEKAAFLSEDGKVCFITSFDENSFLTMS